MMRPDTRKGNAGSGLRTDTGEPQYTGVIVKISSEKKTFVCFGKKKEQFHDPHQKVVKIFIGYIYNQR